MGNFASQEITGKDIPRLRGDAESRSGTLYVVLGLLTAPILLCLAWYWSHDSATVRKTGTGIFYIGSIVFALAFMRFSHYSDKLTSLKQMDSVMIRGVLGPVKKEYRANYDFENFKLSDFESYKKMHVWGGLLAIAFFALCSWLFTINVFHYLIWK